MPAFSRTAFALVLLGGPFMRHSDPAALHVGRTYYENGRLAEERPYLDGRESGVHRAWWPNGTPRFVYGYAAGVLEGESREWFPSGALWRDQHYSKGHEAGLQRLYWEDGRVRASYEVREGRRYGLMGAKGCATRSDSSQVTP